MSDLFNWDNQLLEPVIITYNRAALLEKTLQVFYDNSLKNMRLHVLNNASTDNTAEIVKKIQTRWPNVIYHENPYNIGGNANILRAVELSDAEYHWVIGDDDEWLLDRTKLAELVAVLKTKAADVIRLGWLASQKSRKSMILARDLIPAEPLFFASVSMISATIIRRSIISQYLPLAYQNISESYPQLVPIIRAVEEIPMTVYTTATDLLIHTPSQAPGYFHGDLEWYAGWYRTARFFQDKVLKAGFVNEVTLYMCKNKANKFAKFIWLLKVMLYYKSFGLKQTDYLTTMLMYDKNGCVGMLTLIVINKLTPIWFLRVLRKIYFKLFNLPPKTLNVNRSRL